MMRFPAWAKRFVAGALTTVALACGDRDRTTAGSANSASAASSAAKVDAALGSSTPIDEQVFPITEDEPIPTFTEVAKAMIGDPTITVAEAEQHLKIEIARKFMAGGERYYATTTGETISDLSETLFARVPKDDQPLLYAALWLRENSPARVSCARHNFPIVKNHPSFVGLARGCLFRANSPDDENRVARSIVRNFCLGGEYQVDQSAPTSQWKRERRIGTDSFRTISQYVDLLVSVRGNAAYCETMAALKAPENREMVDRLIESYKKQK